LVEKLTHAGEGEGSVSGDETAFIGVLLRMIAEDPKKRPTARDLLEGDPFFLERGFALQ